MPGPDATDKPATAELPASALGPRQELETLASTIRAAHDAAGHAARNFLEHALAAGDALIEAKEKVGHGNWLAWLKNKCDLSEDRAERYMRIARGRGVLEANSARMRNLTLAQAQRLIEQSERAAAGVPPPKTARRTEGKPLKRSLDPLAWAEASPPERTHFVDAIGWSALHTAIPAAWDLERRCLRAVSNEKLLGELERRLPADLWKKHRAAMTAIARALESPGRHVGPTLELTAAPITESELKH